MPRESLVVLQHPHVFNSGRVGCGT